MLLRAEIILRVASVQADSLGIVTGSFSARSYNGNEIAFRYRNGNIEYIFNGILINRFRQQTVTSSGGGGGCSECNYDEP
jgi:hypothetical protein